MKVEEGKTSHSQEAIGQIWQTKMSTQASVVSIEAVCIALSLLAELNRMLIYAADIGNEVDQQQGESLRRKQRLNNCNDRSGNLWCEQLP